MVWRCSQCHFMPCSCYYEASWYYLPLLNDQTAKIMHYSIRSLPPIYNSPVAPPAKNYESAFPLPHALKQYNINHSYPVTNILLTPKTLAFKFLLQLHHLPTLLECPTPFEYLPVTNCPAPFLLQYAPPTPSHNTYSTSQPPPPLFTPPLGPTALQFSE